MTPIKILNLFLLQIVLLFLAACSEYQSPQSSQNGVIYCIEGDPEYLNPQLVTSAITSEVSVHTVFEQLIQFAPGTTDIIPGLAKYWEISDDGRQYTFYLRKNIQFHSNDIFEPSRNLNADDVLLSFNRQWNFAHNYHYVNGGNYTYFESAGLYQLIKAIERIDDLTVRFTLNEAESPFLSQLAMGFASIHSKEYADLLLKLNQPEMLDSHPIGTGPFKFSSYREGSYIRFKKNLNYWKGEPNIDSLVFAITPDSALRYARITSGECDMAQQVLSQIDLLKRNKEIDVIESAGLNIAYWAFNTTKPPLDNLKVRQALNHAINKENILNIVYNNLALKAKNPIPPTLLGYNDNIKDYEYNPEKARQLLLEAGYINGFTIDIFVPEIPREYNPNAKKTASLIQFDLQQIGVKANIVSTEWSLFLQKVSRGDHMTALLGWVADSGDPDNFFTPLLSCSGIQSGSNRAFWCNDEFDKLLKKARMVTDPMLRGQYYRQAQTIFKQHAPWFTIAHGNQYKVVRSDVSGVKASPVGSTYFYDLKRKRGNQTD